ncbi:MAG: ABC transporter permease [Eubacteriales bacterium]|nr:ABC transporter permease [Eubacteriales bacterium]
MNWVLLLQSGIAIATVFLFGCVGEILMEKAGHLNLGIPGVMCFGTLGGCLGVSLFMSNYSSDYSAAPWFGLMIVALLFSALFSAIAGLIYGFLTVSLRANQNVTGLALTTFGAGLADYFMNSLNKDSFSYAATIIRSCLPFAQNNDNWFVQIFFNHGFLVYFAIILSILVAIVLRKTRVGLNLRAIGENPAAADAAGINVNLYKYLAIIQGSIIAGFGGLFYVMDYVGGSWENSNTIQAFGWLALALVIFTVWRSNLAILGSIIFGILFILPSFVSGISFLQMQAMKLIPYIATVLVLILTSIIGKKSVQPPASLGLSYFREDR